MNQGIASNANIVLVKLATDDIEFGPFRPYLSSVFRAHKHDTQRTDVVRNDGVSHENLAATSRDPDCHRPRFEKQSVSFFEVAIVDDDLAVISDFNDPFNKVAKF